MLARYDLLLCGSHGGEPCAVGAGLRGGVVGGLWLIGRIARRWRAAVLQGL